MIKEFAVISRKIKKIIKKYPSGGGTGAEVIYALRNNEKLSSNILSELAKEGQTIRKYYQKRGTTNSNKDYYFIHRDTPNTEAVIVEYGFLDTKADADRLKKNYKDYALAVVEAVLDYKGIVPEQTDYYTVKKGDTIFMGNNEYYKKINQKNDIIILNRR